MSTPDDRLTEALAARILGWKLAPDRFVKPNRSWLPKWKFTPTTRIEHAFELLDAAATAYSLVTTETGAFTAEIRVGLRIGRASGESRARTIVIAIARAVGLEPD